MATYRLVIHFQGRLLGQFDATGPSALANIELLASSLRQAAGYELELLAAQGERRILETSPDAIRVLSAEPLFAPVKAWSKSAE